MSLSPKQPKLPSCLKQLITKLESATQSQHKQTNSPKAILEILKPLLTESIASTVKAIKEIEDFTCSPGSFVLSQNKNFFLSVYVLEPGQKTAIHDHGLSTWVFLLEGTTQNTTYTILENNTVREKNKNTLFPGDHYFLEGHQPHVDQNIGNTRTIEFHFYPGDPLSPEVNKTRYLWDFKHKIRHPYNPETFIQFAAEK